MTGKWKRFVKSEGGAVHIVEAAFVFPVMFIILFFLLYLGNAYYIRAQIESVVETYAIRGAGYCADPLLETIREEGSLPEVSDLKTQPYRYIFGGMDEVEKEIGKEVQKQIVGNSHSAFRNMSPKLKTSAGEIAKFHNYVVYSTFSVEVEYVLEFPIRFFDGSGFSLLTIRERAEMPVSDTTEFIRNTDMVIDLLEDTKVGKGISDAFGKVNDFISSFAKK